MAGYDGYSMSNNAVNAYDDGMVPLSKINSAWLSEHGIPRQVAGQEPCRAC